jgi:hypothetical protein
VIARVVAGLALLALVGATPQDPGGAPPPPTPGIPAAIQATAALSPRSANYTITATLDPATRTITGEQVLTWRNTSTIAATTLQFHLYYNAWRNLESTWLRETRLAGDRSASSLPPEYFGSIDVTRIGIDTGAGVDDRTSHLRFIAPDDGNREDRTVAELPLDRPVQPGETVRVQIAWSSRVPRTFARTGTIGDYYFIAQWFPKIGVLEDTGWNCHQFHAATEFYADFGVYDVRLTVPSGWVVGATGVERGREDHGNGTTTHHYYQEDVHGFAWTTSPRYLERTDTFTHPTLPHVRMRLLLQPEHADQASRHFEATRAALKYYGEWYGPYPYGHITVIDPAWQSGAGGMEYPTLFTAGTRWLAPRDVTQPEGVTIHEAGHQFWYGIVANNEFEHAWLDEGLNTFSTARVIEQAFEPNYYVRRYFGGFIPWVFRDIRVSRATDGNRLSGYRLAARMDAQATPTWRYWPGSASAITYNKTALWLHTLERMLGWDTLQRVLSTYYSRWAFKHPKPADFFNIVHEVSGQDVTWFFDEVHRSAGVFDYGIDAFRSERSPQAATGDVLYRTQVVARRYGDGIFPVDVRVVFDNGEELRWRWDGTDTWKAFDVEKPVRAIRAEVDPDRVLLLDINYTNNSSVLRPAGSRAATKWSMAWLIWLQDHLLTYGFFA